jgi:integrase
VAGSQPNSRPKIYKGRDGLYHCYVTVGTKPTGQLDRRHRQGETATEVAAKVDELLAQVERGHGVAPTKIETVGEWLAYWVEHVVKPARAWKTYAGYKSLIDQHMIPAIGAWRLDGHKRRLEPEHVEAMYTRMRTAKLASTGKQASRSYILQAHRVLRKALKDAQRRGRTGRNVCDMIDPPTARAKKIDAHTLNEGQAIVRAAMDDPMGARWLLGMLLGPRQGETLGLRWDRVHLDPPGGEQPYVELETQLQRRTWEHGCADPAACAAEHCRTEPCRLTCADHRGRKGCTDRCRPRCTRHKRACPKPCRPGCTGHARHCPKRVGGGLVEVELKTQGSERRLPLPPVLVELLRQHRKRQQAQFFQLGTQWSGNGLVFTTEFGKPVDPKRDHGAWEKLLQRAGVEDSRLHAARHTAGTMLLATGTDVRIVQAILGHARITTTQIYTDVATEVKREAVDRAMAALLDGNLAALLQRDGATGKASD